MKFTKAMKMAANESARAEDLNDFYVDLGYGGVLDAARCHVDEQSPASSRSAGTVWPGKWQSI